MIWRYVNTGFNTGKFNMGYDLQLANYCKPGEAVLRLYRWNPYCISLGANQSFESINISKTNTDKIDVVKRPTGGRAILHSEELTYSVVIPTDHNSSAKNIYSDINKALSNGLSFYSDKLKAVELEKSQPDFREFYKNDFSAACFAAPAKNELKLNGHKLVGSAQRKLGNTILQHGSILCGEYHKNIVDYLAIDEENHIKVKILLNQTADLHSITGQEVDYDLLEKCVVLGFESFYNIKLHEMNTEELFETSDEIICNY